MDTELAWLEDPDPTSEPGPSTAGAPTRRSVFLGMPLPAKPYLAPTPPGGSPPAEPMDGTAARGANQGAQETDVEEGEEGEQVGAGDAGGWVPIMTLATLRREVALARAHALAARGDGGGSGSGWSRSSAEDVAEALMSQGDLPHVRRSKNFCQVQQGCREAA